MKPHIFFILFLTILPASLGFDCDYFSGYQKQECLELESTNESLISNLIYSGTYIPNHEFVKNYNSKIDITDAPEDTQKYSNGIIKNAWVSILYASPSVYYKKLYVPENFNIRTEYDYKIQLPQNYYNNRKSSGSTCKILYSLKNQNADLKVSTQDEFCNSKECPFSITQDEDISARLDIQATRKEEHYRWYRYCCSYGDNGCTGYCYDCRYYRTKYNTDSLSISDNLDVYLYSHSPDVNVSITKASYDSYKADLNTDNQTNVFLKFKDSYYNEYQYEYSSEFIKYPTYLLRIKADKKQSSSLKNIIKTNNLLYVKNHSYCYLEYSDFFSNQEKMCSFDLVTEIEVEEFKKTELSESWNLLYKVIVFIVANILIFIGIKKTWGKALIPSVLMLILIPSVSAENCGLTNLASCLPEKMYDFFIELLNAPIEPLLDLTRTLLETAPSISLFEGVWAIVVYCISMFYGLLFIYSGFQFMFSGHNVIKREMAKEWLKNTVIMITIVQASFYLYGLTIELGSVMSSSVLSMVDPHFFMITADNLINIGLEFLFVGAYVIILFFTILFLVMRYLVVCFGVLFAPIGVFCYFIPPLKSYGKLILNLLGMFIFITFLDAIIILACSMLIEISLFENIKILVMICCFMMINLLFLVLIKHIISKSSFSDSGEKVAQAVKYIAMFV